MKVCPKCGESNLDDAKVCKSCGYEFTEAKKNFEWVFLKRCKNQFEADLIAGLLESNDIITLVKRPGPMEGGVISNPYADIFLGPNGAFDVFVMESDLEEAKKILEAFEKGGTENGTNEDDNEGS